MDEHDNEWSRRNAEDHIADLLDAAKAGATQTIVDFDGNFEVRFLAPVVKLGLSRLVADGEVVSDVEEELEITEVPVIIPRD